MSAYTELQQAEFAAEREGYTATRHQREVGTGYFDLVTEVVSAGTSSTRALEGSTEAAQFQEVDRLAAAEMAIAEDHVQLERISQRVRAAKDAPGLALAAEDLSLQLAGHFAREEAEDGLHGLVVSRAPQHRGAFLEIAAEHRRLLSEARSLAERARAGQAAEVAAEMARLAARLQQHEERENALTRAALGRAAA
jgi:hypothetical protein